MQHIEQYLVNEQPNDAVMEVKKNCIIVMHVSPLYELHRAYELNSLLMYRLHISFKISKSLVLGLSLKGLIINFLPEM